MSLIGAVRRIFAGRPFVRGVAVGIVAVFALEYAINETPVADWIISPLLLRDSNASADAIVALGAGVTAECVPNLNAVRRALLAARLWRSGRAPFVLFTGGSPVANCSVAEAMASLARELGVPAASVRVETASRNTHENGELGAATLHAMGARHILLVTDRLHMRRAEGVFARQGFATTRAAVPIQEGHLDNVSMLHAGIREYLALAYYSLRGWTADAIPAPPISQPGPADASEHLMQVAVKNPDGPIVILGASYAGGWKVSTLAGVPVINRGVAGQQTSAMLARFESDVVAAGPRAVLLWGFINDVSQSTPDDAAKLQERIRENYRQMIVLARRSQIQPVLATELTFLPPASAAWSPRAWAGWLLGRESYQDRVNRQVLALNEWIKELAQREGLPLLDVHAAMADATGRRRRAFTQDDGSHITQAGYDALSLVAEPFFAAQIVRREGKRE